MSVIRVDNFGPSAGGTTYSARGIAKAWVNLNGTGTIAARETLNVSSLTDNGTGDYYVSFTAAFENANFVGSGSFAWSNNGNQIIVSFVSASQGRAATLEGNAYVDRSLVMAAYHGDLA